MLQHHPFLPLYDENAEILILGSFPSVKTREVNFFYGHPQNRFWQVIAAVFGSETPQSVQEKKEFIFAHKLAIWDVLSSCYIENSADSTIKRAKANDLSNIFENADIKKIFVNGRAAEKYYTNLIEPKLKRKAVYLPSTSPANSSYSLEMLIKEWQIINSK